MVAHTYNPSKRLRKRTTVSSKPPCSTECNPVSQNKDKQQQNSQASWSSLLSLPNAMIRGMCCHHNCTSNSCVITWSKKTNMHILHDIKIISKEYLILYLKSFKSINSDLFPLTNNWNYLGQGLYWAQGIWYRLVAPIRELTRELSWKKNRITYHRKSYSTLPSTNMTIQNDSHLQVQSLSPITCRDYISTPLNLDL